jgi:hypothetical protein
VNLTRETDAHVLNRIANDPSIYEFVRGYQQGRLDLTEALRKPQNVLLSAEHGCILFDCWMPGLYEAHTTVLPAGRGAWTLDMVNSALRFMFCGTDAIEIFTRVPKGNLAARALAGAIHGTFEFRRKGGWVKDNDPIPADIFSLDFKQWGRTAPGLQERGVWFHHRLESEYARFGRVEPPHEDDAVHDRHVGAAIEMIFGGQPDKGVLLYNRWAMMAGYQPVSIVVRNPLTINIRDALIIVRGGDFWVASLLGK